ncbi:hypothetical protein ACIGBL_33445 [Streptomyces sp. NPDC085614]|uniref:hypothetical protein n=1 Tax=Streptomyces sp. NPDC085614 TaxID=3365733 RepID=UPI0037D2B34E
MSIPGAALAVVAAGLDDYRLTTPADQQTPEGAAERACEYLASSGWTITPHVPTDQVANP